MVSIQQPLGLEGGHQGGELGLKKVVGVAGEVEEAFIAPDDVIGVRPEDGDGEGEEIKVRREATSTPLVMWFR
ncbi:MAG: hypothetical protein ACLR1T_10180 [Evtepia gabavorous]